MSPVSSSRQRRQFKITLEFLAKILVAVKRVVDAKVKSRPLPDRSGPDTKLARMAINRVMRLPSRKRLNSKAGKVQEVVAVTIGDFKSVDVLRTAMAIGADRSIHVSTDEMMEPLAAAKILAKIAEREKPDLILMGKQAIDDDAAQTGPMLSELLNLPLAAFASEIELADGRLIVTRETDGGTQTISVTLPAVVTADLRLAEPRYVTLPSMARLAKNRLKRLGLHPWALIQLPARNSLALNRRPHARLG